MSPNAQRIAIATACGWADVKAYPMPLPPESEEPQLIIVAGRHAAFSYVHSVPDYPGSLDAMQSVIRSLTVDKVQKIAEQLVYSQPRNYELSAIGCVLLATPAQLAEAFLRTLNLWDDTK